MSKKGTWRCARLAAMAALVLAAAGEGQAGLLLSDNFNDNSLAATWSTNTSIPQGGASVTEQNQRVEIVARGHLLTSADYNPAPTALSGLRVRGEWTFANLAGMDFFQALTRSDGQPAGSYGETANGIEYYMVANGNPQSPTIRTRNGSTIGVGSVASFGSLTINQGDVYYFDILDGGRNLYFRLTDASNPANTAYATARVTSDSFATDRVVFHNRESSGRTAYLDNVSLTGMRDVAEYDDFNDNFLEPSRWTVNTSIPQGGASVTEQNQRVELVARGHLVSFREFDPDTTPGVQLRGEWTFANLGSGGDFLQILTRSDGVPAGSWGETANGLEFFVAADGSAQSLDIRTRGGSITIGNEVAIGTVTITQGDVFQFTILDDGGRLFFSLTEIGNPLNTASVTADVLSDTFGQDFVVFHNREGGGRTAYLDNVSIVILPEPTTLALLGLGAAAAGLRRRRARPR